MKGGGFGRLVRRGAYVTGVVDACCRGVLCVVFGFIVYSRQRACDRAKYALLTIGRSAPVSFGGQRVNDRAWTCALVYHGLTSGGDRLRK